MKYWRSPKASHFAAIAAVLAVAVDETEGVVYKPFFFNRDDSKFRCEGGRRDPTTNLLLARCPEFPIGKMRSLLELID
jgi:hypothetical protein